MKKVVKMVNPQLSSVFSGYIPSIKAKVQIMVVNAYVDSLSPAVRFSTGAMSNGFIAGHKEIENQVELLATKTVSISTSIHDIEYLRREFTKLIEELYSIPYEYFSKLEGVKEHVEIVSDTSKYGSRLKASITSCIREKELAIMSEKMNAKNEWYIRIAMLILGIVSTIIGKLVIDFIV